MLCVVASAYLNLFVRHPDFVTRRHIPQDWQILLLIAPVGRPKYTCGTRIEGGNRLVLFSSSAKLTRTEILTFGTGNPTRRRRKAPKTRGQRQANKTPRKTTRCPNGPDGERMQLFVVPTVCDALIVSVSPLRPGQTVLRPTQANSSQVTKPKLVSAGGQTIPSSRASSQENHSIVWLRPRSHLTTTKQLRWRWPNSENLGSNWAKIRPWSNSSELDPARANTSQVGGQTIPNPIQAENLARVGWVGSTVWPELQASIEWSR